jgi:L-rhamnose mutarotase
MERLCFVIHLFPGAESEYDLRHDEIWPDMSEAIKEAGFINYSLFRRGSEVIGYAECIPDIATVLTRMGAAEVNDRWGESLASVISSMADETGGLIQYGQMWHLD